MAVKLILLQILKKMQKQKRKMVPDKIIFFLSIFKKTPIEKRLSEGLLDVEGTVDI